MTEYQSQIESALREDRVIDITTTGRKSGQPRRIEIWFHNLDGALYLTGLPGRAPGLPTCAPIPLSFST